MKQNRFPTHLSRIAIIILFVALSFSVLGMPAASPVVAQEPTPTSDVSGQIVGGAPADPGEWPWQVALIGGSYVGTDYWPSQFCGGSLVTPQWVVTAAHCVYDQFDNLLPASAIDVVAGIYNLSSSSGSQRRDVTQIIVHPSYSFPYNDIALLKLASPVTIGGTGASKTAVVPLVSASIGDLATEMAWVTGWGDTESSPAFPEELYEVEVPIITNTVCNQSQSYNGGIVSSMLCAGYAEGGKDACYGDSGGPLVVFVDGKWQLAGVVSTGYGCADPDYYGVYTRVSSFTSWVESNIPDLAVNSILIESPDVDLDSNIYANDDVSVYVKVQNISNVATGPFTVNIYVNGTPVACSNENRDYYLNFTGLAAGQLTELKLTIPAGDLDIDDHSITAYADSGCVLDELNKSNNMLTAEFTVEPIPVDAPAHDNVENARVISGYPYTDTVDVRGATRHASDPTDMTCTIPNGTRDVDAGLASVWYQYTATSDTTLFVDTFGSNYDTYLAAWQGGIPGVGSLIGCNEDSGSAYQSALSVPVTNGTTYYFLVAQFSNDETNVEVEGASLDGKSATDVEAQAGGNLVFRVRDIPEVDISIGGNIMGTYLIPYGTSMRQKYLGISDGPVLIQSTDNITPIIAGMRIICNVGCASYDEIMGFPNDKLTNEYWFPYYNNVDLDSQLRVGNAGNVPTSVDVYLAGQLIDTFSLQVGESKRIKYVSTSNGPLQVISSSANIIAAMRIIANFTPNGGISYVEMMGYPGDQLTNDYWFPYYNNVDLDSQLRVGNAGNVLTSVDVYLAGQLIDTFSLQVGESKRIKYFGASDGPLHIISSDANVIAAMRIICNVGCASYEEIMGFPNDKLTNEYWFPYYNNVDLDSQLRVGNGGNVPTSVDVYLADQLIDTFSLQVGESKRIKYVSTSNGPLQAISSNTNIIVALRSIANFAPNGSISYMEMMGYPGDQLTTDYWFPYYNNVDLDSQFRIGVP